MKAIFSLVVLFLLFINIHSQNTSGRVESIQFYSEINDVEYSVRIYTPPNYDFDVEVSYPVSYFQDGSGYLYNIYTDRIIDDLINEGQTSGIIGVFIDPSNRIDEYLFDGMPKYASFLADELVPYIDSNYRTKTSPFDRMVIGVSYGGNISAFTSYKHSDVFGNCGLQSAAFRPTFDVFRLVVDCAPKPIRFYATWGTNERPIHTDMRRFRDSLLVKGYDFTWEESDNSHTWSAWRNTLSDILTHFFPNEPTSVNLEFYPAEFKLFQNYPNPFNPVTTIQYTIPKDVKRETSNVKLMIYDVLGNEIATLVNETKAPGTYEVHFSASDLSAARRSLSSGIYFYAINAGDFHQIKKMILLK